MKKSDLEYFRNYKKENIKTIKIDVQKELKEEFDKILKKRNLKTSTILRKVIELIIEEDEDFLKHIEK